MHKTKNGSKCAPLTEKFAYNIVDEYDGEGDEVVDDLEEALSQNLNSFTRPVTFQLMIAIGFTH